MVKHLSRFGPYRPNEFMIDRLRRVAARELEATIYDIHFYTHELREYQRYCNLGWETGLPTDIDEADALWNNAYSATLEDYRLADWEIYPPNAPED